MANLLKCACIQCHKELTVSALGNHYNSIICKNPYEVPTEIDIPLNLHCAFCSKMCKSASSYRQHYIRCNFNPSKIKRSTKQIVRVAPAWNKGLTKITDDRVRKNSEAVSKKMKQLVEDGMYIPITQSVEARKATSERMSMFNTGGKSKWYEVAGQKCQGTWERNVALKFEELGIKWIKLKVHKDILEYVMDDNVRSYTPDFYLPAYDVYLEIKGYWWGRDREKMDIVLRTYPDKKIIIVEKTDYVRILRGELVW